MAKELESPVSIEEVIEMLEEKKAAKRERIGKTRTKQESSELRGEVFGIDEAIYAIKSFVKGGKATLIQE